MARLLLVKPEELIQKKSDKELSELLNQIQNFEKNKHIDKTEELLKYFHTVKNSITEIRNLAK